MTVPAPLDCDAVIRDRRERLERRQAKAEIAKDNAPPTTPTPEGSADTSLTYDEQREQWRMSKRFRSMIEAKLGARLPETMNEPILYRDKEDA